MLFKGMRMIQIGVVGGNYGNFSFSLRGGARGRFARFSEYAKNSIYIYIYIYIREMHFAEALFRPGAPRGGLFCKVEHFS